MIKYYLFFLLTFLSISANSQNQIIDSESKKPVSYAHIKLTNKSKGVISDFNGYFSLNPTFNAKDSIVISCIGYNKRTLLIGNLQKTKVIELSPNVENLSEVTYVAKKTRFQSKKLGIKKKPKKNRFADYAGTGKNGEEKAIWIPNDYSIAGYLKKINVFVTDLGYPDAHFRVHVYDCNKIETKPDKELTTTNIIASATKGNEWVTIDMSDEMIRIGENGCFIGIEWFDSPKSKYHQDTILNEGYTWQEGKRKDTIYSRVRKGNGAVLGAIYQKYRYSKNKLWRKVGNSWNNLGTFTDSMMNKTDTLPDGRTLLRTPDNHYQGVLCINVNVSFPKNKIKLSYKEPKKRKLNKLEKVKQDLFNYPQNNIYELFSSLIKAFENDDLIYVLKYLCIYKEDQLDEILSEILDEQNENYISEEEKDKAVTYLKKLRTKLKSADLVKVDNKYFKIAIDNTTYNLIVDDGLWKINPYGYRIYKKYE